MHRGWLIGMLLRTASLIALAFPAIGCAPAKIVNALVLGEGYRIVRDLAYGPGPRRKLDLYVPDDLCESAPVVVFFYGGRWESGSKEDYLFVGQALASVGFIAVIPDYRLYPEVRFPVFVEDGAAALRWVFDHARGYGGDPERIFLAGHSAGAHIAALLALDEGHLASKGVKRSAIEGLIGLRARTTSCRSRTRPCRGSSRSWTRRERSRSPLPTVRHLVRFFCTARTIRRSTRRTACALPPRSRPPAAARPPASILASATWVWSPRSPHPCAGEHPCSST